MRTRDEILEDIKSAVKQDYDEFEGDAIAWEDLITSDPSDKISELFTEADFYGSEFCERVFDVTKLAIRTVISNERGKR